MQSSDWLSVLARIALPCVVAVVLQLQPLPDLLKTNLKAGREAEQAGNSLEAAEHYTAAAEAQPWREGLLEKAGLLFYEGGDAPHAAQELQGALDREQLSETGQIALGNAYYQTGAYPQAMEIWTALLQDPAVDSAFYEDVTDKLAAAGLVEDQTAVYSQWVINDPHNSRAVYRLGLLQSVYDPLQAVSFLSLAKSLDSSLAEPVDEVLDVLASMQEADERYRLVMIGRTLGNLGEWAIANRAFQKAVDLDPEYGDAWAFLAESLQQLGKPALKAIETANELSPDSIGVKTLTAMYWQRQNKPELALQIMQEIADLRPGEYIWLIEMGNIAADGGDLDTGLTYITKAIEAEPQNPQWRRALVAFCLENNYEIRTLGLPAAREYLRLSQESADALSIMGAVMLNLQDTLSAERYLTRALKLDPGNADTHLTLAQVYLMDSKPVQAYNHLNAVLNQTSSQSETAKMAMRLMEKYYPDGAPETP